MKLGIRVIVFSVLLTSIPVAGWWLVFRPNNRLKAEMTALIDARQAKLQALNRATATIGDLKTEIAALEGAITFFRSKLPSEKEIDKVLQEVWKLAEANQLNTKSIRTMEPKKETMLSDPVGPYAEQPISLKLEGPFQGFYGFLLALERQPRIVRIQQMSLRKPTAKETPEGHVQAECNLAVFFERSVKE